MQILLTISKNLPHKIHKGKPCTRKLFIEKEQILKINATKTHLRADSRQGLSEKPVKTVRNPAGDEQSQNQSQQESMKGNLPGTTQCPLQQQSAQRTGSPKQDHFNYVPFSGMTKELYQVSCFTASTS